MKIKCDYAMDLHSVGKVNKITTKLEFDDILAIAHYHWRRFALKITASRTKKVCVVKNAAYNHTYNVFEPQHAISGADDEFLRYAFITPLIKQNTRPHTGERREKEKRCQKKRNAVAAADMYT